LTYDLHLQSQASQGQGRPSRQKSRSKVKLFKQESAHRQTDTHAHGRYQTYYRPCYAVDEKVISRMSNFDKILHGGVDLGIGLQALWRYGKDGEYGDLK